MKMLHVLTVCALVSGSSALMAMGTEKDDTSITNDVKSKITTSTNVPATSAPNVVVHTKEGKVLITGSVDTKTQEKEIKNLVKEMEGVKDVKLDLKVLSD